MIQYQTKITRIGSQAFDALADSLLILFDENVPEAAADYCFIHAPGPLTGEIKPGGTVKIGTDTYSITAVGGVVTKNLGQIGHITIIFDGAESAQNPGSLHVLGPIPDTLEPGTSIEFHS